MKKINTLLILFLACIFSSSYTQAQQRERLMAYTRYIVPNDSSSFQTSDSTTLSYIGTRPINRAIFQNSYDSSVWWYAPIGHSYELHGLSNLLWSVNNVVQSDTVWNWDSTTNNYYYKSYYTNTYDTAYRWTSRMGNVWDTSVHVWVNSTKEFFTFNSANLETEYITIDWFNNAWDTTLILYNTYNNNNQISTSIRKNINLFFPYYVNSTRTQYSYDALGRIDTILEDTRGNDTTNWVHSSLTVDSFDVNNNMVLSLSQYWNTAGWYNGQLALNTYDANHNLIGYLLQIPDSVGQWINSQQYQATYDSYNMTTSESYITWNTASQNWVPQAGNVVRHYYYELYTPTGIAEIQATGDVRIYPVPAADMLSLDLKWDEAQASTATIYDMTGRKINESTLPYAATYHGYIPVQGLSAGTYTIEIKGASGSISKTFNVMR